MDVIAFMDVLMDELSKYTRRIVAMSGEFSESLSFNALQ